MQFASCAQSFDRSDENEVRCTRAKTGRGLGGQNEKFTRLKMCRGLETDFCEVRNGIAAALGHLLNLIKDEVVVITGE